MITSRLLDLNLGTDQKKRTWLQWFLEQNRALGSRKSIWRWKTFHTKSEYCFCVSSRDSVPERGRLEKLLLSFYLHELSTQYSCWPSCLLWDVKRKVKGRTNHFKNTKVMDCSKCKSHGFIESQWGSGRNQSAPWVGLGLSEFVFHEGNVMETQRTQDAEIEAVAQIWRSLKYGQLSPGLFDLR